MTASNAETAVVLTAHGTVTSLDELPEFLTNIRRGHAPPSELVAEVRRRYEAIGGKSPLLDVTYSVAQKLEKELGLRTDVAMRLFRPYPKEVVSRLVAGGVKRIVTVPLAQHSAGVYGAAMTAAAREVDPSLEVLCAPNWGQTPELTHAFAPGVKETLSRIPSAELDRAVVIFTAHSLPVGVIKAGDPYEREFRASAEAVAAEVRPPDYRVAFQSQGIGSGVEWLGPDLDSTFREVAAAGKKHVVVAPIGFLADHVETLYDLDIEARALAERTYGLTFYRSASLNADDALVKALAKVAQCLLEAR